jgi:hypothetical protein
MSATYDKWREALLGGAAPNRQQRFLKLSLMAFTRHGFTISRKFTSFAFDCDRLKSPKNRTIADNSGQ